MFFTDLFKRLPFLRQGGAQKNKEKQTILAKEAMTYDECEVFLPLKHNDVVYVIRSYDGDTVTLAWVDRTGRKVRLGCRLRGYDSPELRGSSPHEKALALKAKERLDAVTTGEFVTVLNPGLDKYGRILCNLRTKSVESVSDHMLAGGPDLARPYFGGKKEGWSRV